MTKEVSNLENVIAWLRNLLADPNLSLELRTSIENLLPHLERDLEAARTASPATILPFSKTE